MSLDYQNEFGQITWKFICASYRIFNKLQIEFNEIINNEIKYNMNDKKLKLKQYSKLFRKVLLENLANDIKILVNTLEKIGSSQLHLDSFDLYLDKIYSIEQFWSLCEIYLLNNNDYLLIEVINWLKVLIAEYNVQQYFLDFTSIIESYNNLNNNENTNIYEKINNNNYFEVIFGLAINGQLNDIWTLLSIHPDFQQLYLSINNNNSNNNFTILMNFDII